MKFPTKAIFTTALSVFLSHPVNAQGLVLQLNTETGELVPFDPKKEEGKQDITSASLPYTARGFNPMPQCSRLNRCLNKLKPLLVNILVPKEFMTADTIANKA